MALKVYWSGDGYVSWGDEFGVMLRARDKETRQVPRGRTVRIKGMMRI